MDKRFLNGGDGTGENAKSGGNGFYLRECILTGKETAKYKTQCGEGESARTDLGQSLRLALAHKDFKNQEWQ